MPRTAPGAAKEDLTVLFATLPPHKDADGSPLHLHSYYELLLSLESSEGSTTLDGRELSLERPFVLLMSPYCAHRFTVRRAEQRIELRFGDRVLERHPGIRPILSRLLQKRSSTLLYPQSHSMAQLGALCRQIQALGDSPYAAECLLEALLSLLAEQLPSARRQANEHHSNFYISDVIRYIAEHLSEKLTAPRLADAFFVSRDKLNRDFKQYTSVTLGHFISTVRLEHAKELLKARDTNHLSIKEISEACGFESDVYFYAFFKENIGMTPRQFEEEYRRAHGS